jgi:hypothetical protein
VAFSSKTDTPLKGKCDIEFRAESAKRYGTELLKFSDKVRKCSTTAPVPASVLKAQKGVTGAAKDAGKASSHLQAEKLLNLVAKLVPSFDQYVGHATYQLARAGAKKIKTLMKASRAAAAATLSEVVAARGSMREANTRYAGILKEKANKERENEGIKTSPPSDSEWVCDSDPSQTGKIKATVGGETCDSAVQFATSSGSLDATCKQQFSGDSAEIYGKAQLHLARVLSACANIKPADGAAAKKAKAAEKTSKEAKVIEKKQAAEEEQKMISKKNNQEVEAKRVKTLEVAAKKAQELADKERAKAQEIKNKAMEERQKAQQQMMDALARGAFMCPKDPSQYGTIKATKGSCAANIGFVAGTATPLTTECDVIFKSASALIYGGALIEYAAMLQKCPEVKPPPKDLQKAAAKAASAEKAATPDKKTKEKKAVRAVKSALGKLQQGVKESIDEAAAIPANETALQQVLTLVTGAMKEASETAKYALIQESAVKKAKAQAEKLAKKNKERKDKELQAKEDAKWNWKCPSDKKQRGSIKATFEKCDAAVSFATASKGQLKGDCTRQFRISSSKAYGDALLRFSEMVKGCKTLNKLSSEQKAGAIATASASEGDADKKAKDKDANDKKELEKIEKDASNSTADGVVDPYVQARRNIAAYREASRFAAQATAELDKQKADTAAVQDRFSKVKKRKADLLRAHSAAAPVQWACSKDPTQVGQIKGQLKGHCEAGLEFSTFRGTKKFTPECETEFRSASMVHYGKMLLVMAYNMRQCSVVASPSPGQVRALTGLYSLHTDEGKPQSLLTARSLLEEAKPALDDFLEFLRKSNRPIVKKQYKNATAQLKEGDMQLDAYLLELALEEERQRQEKLGAGPQKTRGLLLNSAGECLGIREQRGKETCSNPAKDPQPCHPSINYYLTVVGSAASPSCTAWDLVDGKLVTDNGIGESECLGVVMSEEKGTMMTLVDCDEPALGSQVQLWEMKDDGTIVNQDSGGNSCMYDSSQLVPSGEKLMVWDCNANDAGIAEWRWFLKDESKLQYGRVPWECTVEGEGIGGNRTKQTGAFFIGSTTGCESSISFSTKSGPLSEACQMQFRGDSAERFGFYVLRQSRMIKSAKCESVPPIDDRLTRGISRLEAAGVKAKATALKRVSKAFAAAEEEWTTASKLLHEKELVTAKARAAVAVAKAQLAQLWRCKNHPTQTAEIKTVFKHCSAMATFKAQAIGPLTKDCKVQLMSDMTELYADELMEYGDRVTSCQQLSKVDPKVASVASELSNDVLNIRNSTVAAIAQQAEAVATMLESSKAIQAGDMKQVPAAAQPALLKTIETIIQLLQALDKFLAQMSSAMLHGTPEAERGEIWECPSDPAMTAKIQVESRACSAWVAAAATAIDWNGSGSGQFGADCQIHLAKAVAKKYGAEMLQVARELRKCHRITPLPTALKRKGLQLNAAIQTGIEEQTRDQLQKQEARLLSRQASGPELIGFTKDPSEQLSAAEKMRTTAVAEQQALQRSFEKASAELEEARDQMAALHQPVTHNCSSDPSQQLMVISGQQRPCQGSVFFQSSKSIPKLTPDCEQEFQRISMQRYGEALLDYSRTSVNCSILHDVKGSSANAHQDLQVGVDELGTPWMYSSVASLLRPIGDALKLAEQEYHNVHGSSQLSGQSIGKHAKARIPFDLLAKAEAQLVAAKRLIIGQSGVVPADGVQHESEEAAKLAVQQEWKCKADPAQVGTIHVATADPCDSLVVFNASAAQPLTMPCSVEFVLASAARYGNGLIDRALDLEKCKMIIEEVPVELGPVSRGLEAAMVDEWDSEVHDRRMKVEHLLKDTAMKKQLVDGAQQMVAFTENLSRKKEHLSLGAACELSEWSSWSSTKCPHMCNGTEMQNTLVTRTRHITLLPGIAGKACEATEESKSCAALLCPPTACRLAEWSPFSACNASCGFATQTRTRSVEVHPTSGGKGCGHLSESQQCNARNCECSTVRQGSNLWQADGTLTTGSGSVFRLVQPGLTGAPGTVSIESCDKPGHFYQSDGTQGLNLQVSETFDNAEASTFQERLSSDGTSFESVAQRGQFIESDGTSLVMGAPTATGVPPPAAAVWLLVPQKACQKVSEWSEWTECSAECGAGKQLHTRSSLGPATADACDKLTEERTCNAAPCPVDCELDDWRPWAQCDTECDGGTQSRDRTLKKPSQSGGKVCDVIREVRPCNTRRCGDKITLELQAAAERRVKLVKQQVDASNANMQALRGQAAAQAENNQAAVATALAAQQEKESRDALTAADKAMDASVNKKVGHDEELASEQEMELNARLMACEKKILQFDKEVGILNDKFEALEVKLTLTEVKLTELKGAEAARENEKVSMYRKELMQIGAQKKNIDLQGSQFREKCEALQEERDRSQEAAEEQASQTRKIQEGRMMKQKHKEALIKKQAAERLAAMAAAKAYAAEQEHKAELVIKEKEHKVREGKGKENMAKLTDHSGVNARIAKAQNKVAAQAAREQAAKANFGQHEALEQAKKQQEKKELAKKDASKERAVKQRAAKMRGCFIIRDCCPTSGESCATPAKKEYRDTWGEKNQATADEELNCFARAQEVYDECESTLPVVVRFGATGNKFQYPPKGAGEGGELPVLPKTSIFDVNFLQYSR